MSFTYNHLHTIWLISALQNQKNESVGKTVTYKVDTLYHRYILYTIKVYFIDQNVYNISL